MKKTTLCIAFIGLSIFWAGSLYAFNDGVIVQYSGGLPAGGNDNQYLTSSGVFILDGGSMGFPYESAVFEHADDNKFGVYNSLAQPYETGVSFTLGYTGKAGLYDCIDNFPPEEESEFQQEQGRIGSVITLDSFAGGGSDMYAGFEMQLSGYPQQSTSCPQDYLLRFNFLGRNSDGLVIFANTAILDVRGSGDVAVSNALIVGGNIGKPQEPVGGTLWYDIGTGEMMYFDGFNSAWVIIGGTTSMGTTTIAGLPTLQEWLFVASVIIFLLSLMTWKYLFRPTKDIL